MRQDVLFAPAVIFGLVVCGGALATPLNEGKAAFAAGQYEAARQFFHTGAQAGDAASRYHLGRMLELGLGVAADKTAALQLYRQAADAGNAEALNRVALMHYRGEGEASPDYAKAARLFRIAADRQDRNALFNLGKLHFEGLGVEKDVTLAIAYYRKAADLDHILALNTLGTLYLAGARSAHERAVARSWFERSAAFGNAVGLYELARLTLGEGNDRSRQITAHTYLNLASARAHPDAPEALRRLSAVMAPADVEAAQSQARAFVALSDERVQ